MKEPVAASSCADGGAGGGACVDDAPLLELEPPLIFHEMSSAMLCGISLHGATCPPIFERCWRSLVAPLVYDLPQYRHVQ